MTKPKIEDTIRRCATNPYKLGSDRILSYGSFSVLRPVVAAKRLSTINRKKLVAKVLKLESDDEESTGEYAAFPSRKPVSQSAAEEEVRILRKLQTSDKIVKMLDAYEIYEEVWIVMEHLSLDLDRFKSALDSPMDIPMISLITADLLDALEFMHSQRVIHLDIKPLNVLLSKQGKIKLCDFGFAKELDDTGSVSVEVAIGSRYYVAPELLFGTHSSMYDSLTDVWSLGVVVHELFSGPSLFQKFYDPKNEDSNAFSYNLWIEYQDSNANYQLALLGEAGVDYEAYPGRLEALKESHPQKAETILGQTEEINCVYSFLRQCLVPLPKDGPVVCPVVRKDVDSRASVQDLKHSKMLKMHASLEHSTRKKLASLVKQFSPR